MDKLFVILFCLCARTAAAGQCGQKPASSRVIGGSIAPPNSWPWQAVLYFYQLSTNNYQPGCGGSIISPYYIVTAAHCVVNKTGQILPASSIVVGVGKHDLSRREPKEKYIRAYGVTVHQGFSMRHLMNDVAVIRLSSPIQFNEAVKPVCLPTAPATSSQNCYITGWGRASRSTKGMYRLLKQAKMPVVSTRICSYYMARVASNVPIGSSSLCSGYGDTKVSGCQGDSGGPYVCKNANGAWELQGAVSWGSEQCSSRKNEYTVYANIHNLKTWITSKTGVN